ncbi:MAG: hypothetical protein OEX81_04260 [Candidatus Pacebacteria bacterium]|nr:hypothetical protein [Candidatus Paceibacterota bacterium]
MSRTKEIECYRRNSALFMSVLAAQVSVLGQENWVNLPQDTHDDSKLPILAGLTHKDYLDGAAIWSAIKDEETLLKFIVMREGFNQGIGQFRDTVANTMGDTLPISRHKASVEEIRNIQKQRDQRAAIVMYLTGNRGLLSPLKGGAQVVMSKKDDVMYPFVNLSDTSPAFPSGSSFGQNVGELLQRTLFNRNQSTEFLYLMKPIKKQDLDEMKEGKKGKEGRAEVLKKLEVLRAYGVLKTALEVASLGISIVNPLVSNLDNIPLLRNAQLKLVEDKDIVIWLGTNGYLSIEEIELLIALKIPSSDEK